MDNFFKRIITLIYNNFIEYSNNDNNKKRIYKSRKDTLMESEIITILILYHLDSRKNLKKFYREYNEILKVYFSKLPYYNRFLVLGRKINNLLPIFIYHLFGKKIGIYYINSIPLAVGKNQRIK